MAKPHFEEMMDKFLYSDQEVQVGWYEKNGVRKPLYRKVIESQNVTTDLSSLSIDTWVDVQVQAHLTTGAFFTVGRYQGGTDFFSYYIFKNNSSINVDLGSTWTLAKVVITILYTKTTD